MTVRDPVPAPDPLLRAPEVSALTGCPIGTLRYLDSVGRGPKSFKLGGRRVWRRSAVLAWIAEAENAEAGTGGGAA